MRKLMICLLVLLVACWVAYPGIAADGDEFSTTSWRIDSNGDLRPVNANTDNIGTSTYYPATVYGGAFIQADSGTSITANYGGGGSWIDVSGGNVFVTSVNTVFTQIDDFANPVAGQVIYLIGGSSTVPTSVLDSGKFNLAGSISLNLDDVLVILVQADDDYIEIGRSIN